MKTSKWPTPCTRSAPTRSGPCSFYPGRAELRLGLRAAIVVAVGSLMQAARADQPATRWLPLAVHVVEREGQPVADEAFVRARVERANEIFAPYRVGFVIEQRATLPAAHADMKERASPMVSI